MDDLWKLVILGVAYAVTYWVVRRSDSEVQDSRSPGSRTEVSCPTQRSVVKEKVLIINDRGAEDDLPFTREDVLEHLSYESLSQRKFRWDDLEFEVLAECSDHRYWIWSVSDEEESYAFVVKRPQGGATIGLMGTRGLSPSEFVEFVQENLIEQAGVP